MAAVISRSGRTRYDAFYHCRGSKRDREHYRFVEDGVSGGWPKILSNLKSLLETGTVLTDQKI